MLCAEETNELKCPTCEVSYHKECAKKWLRLQKHLPAKFFVSKREREGGREGRIERTREERVMERVGEDILFDSTFILFFFLLFLSL